MRTWINRLRTGPEACSYEYYDINRGSPWPIERLLASEANLWSVELVWIFLLLFFSYLIWSVYQTNKKDMPYGLMETNGVTFQFKRNQSVKPSGRSLLELQLRSRQLRHPLPKLQLQRWNWMVYWLMWLSLINNDFKGRWLLFGKRICCRVFELETLSLLWLASLPYPVCPITKSYCIEGMFSFGVSSEK
jgi:hypothetical protein